MRSVTVSQLDKANQCSRSSDAKTMPELGYPYKRLNVPKDWLPINGKLPSEALAKLSCGGTGWIDPNH